MIERPILVAAVLGLCYWLLGAFAFLRRPGLPRVVRWTGASLLALWAGGFIQLIR